MEYFADFREKRQKHMGAQQQVRQNHPKIPAARAQDHIRKEALEAAEKKEKKKE